MFDEIVNIIETEYNNSRNNIGWRFLATSKKTLLSNSGIFLITMNPGGGKDNSQHPKSSCENGCAYISESWKNKPTGESRLQKQFILLFSELAKRHPTKDKIELMESSVCGYFIPFRSPTFNLLKDKKRSIILATNIWKTIISSNSPKLIICIDVRTHKYIRKIIDGLNYNIISNTKYPVGWNNITAELSIYKKNGNALSIIRFPHFSRFSIFGREQSKEPITQIIENATLNIF